MEFEPRSNSWRWDLQSIEAKGFTDNVVDLMVRRLQRLSPAAQEALKQLACLGSQADFSTLAKIGSGSEADVHADFADAVRAGAILSTERSFRFVHDRVQEAAYALISSEALAERHLRIGRLLLSGMSGQDIAERIFDVVNQLNLGSKLISDRNEQQRTAALNLQAAKKAKASTAYSSACRYLAEATAAVGQQGWQDCYDLAFNVCFERAECEFLSSNFGEAAELIEELLLHAQSKVERARAFELRMTLQLVHGDNERAVRTALECLQMFGIELPERPTNDQVHAEYEAVWSNLGPHPIGSLLGLPLMEDLEMRAVMNVFSLMYRSAYFIDTNLCQTIACRMVNVTQKHGTTDGAVIAYALLGVYLGPIFHRYRDGEQFGRLAVAVAERHGFAAQKPGANFGMQMAVIWTQPIEIGLSCLDDAISSAKETGEIIYACYSLEHRLTDRFARGDHLDEIWLEAGNALEFVERIKFRHVADIISGTRLFVQSLRGQVGSAAAVEETALEARLLDAGIPIVICFHWILQIQRHFLLGDPKTALEYADKAKPLLWSAHCQIQFANYCLYHSVALAAVYGTTSPERQAEIHSELSTNLQTLERWAQSCPVTFGHKHLLVCGELARLEGREMEAMRLYERAARAAAEHGFVQDQALANELAGRCCLASGTERAAYAYLREARDCYFRWGALGKVAHLDQHYPAGKPAASPVSRVTIEEATGKLDAATIAKTAQAISSEMVLEDLIKSLVVIAVEHAGAERGLLILPRGAEQRIEAEAIIHDGTVIANLSEQSLAPAASPESIVHHVVRTRENVILDDASAENPFSTDPYIRQKRARSILCLPLLKQTKLVGVLYLENNLAPHVFVPARIAVLKLLVSQAAISLENTRLYHDVVEREAKIRHLVDANIIGIFIWNIEGQIVEANDAFLHMLGYDRDDLVSGRVHRSNLTLPEWRDRDAWTAAEVKMTGTAQPFEKEYVRKDGSRVPVLIGATAFDGKRDQGVGFVLDLTGRKRAEEALRASESKLEEAQRVAHVGYWEYDFLTRRYTFSAETFRIFGRTPQPSTIPVEEILDQVHSEDRPTFDEAVAVAVRDSPRYDMEYRLVRTNGEVRFVHAQGDFRRDASGKAISIFGIIQDITERKQAEYALRASEERWKAVFENNPTMYFMVDKMGTILSVNPFGAEQLGYEVDELIGRAVQEIFHEEDREAVQSNTAICFEELGQAKSWELRKIRKNGDVIWVRETARATMIDNHPSLLIVCEDITEGKRVSEALREARIQLTHANRVATMGQLTASVAHEVSQPIAAACNNATAALSFLDKSPPDLGEVKEAVNCILTDTERARDVIGRIRDHFRKAPPRKETFDLNDAIDEVIALTRSEVAKAGASVQKRLTDGPCPVWADRVQVQQVLLNLVMNATDAMSNVDEGPRELLIGTELNLTGGVLVTVHDSGPGIDQEHLERIFEAFYTTKSSGVGMGLAICRSIINAHGGRLWAEANKSRGAIFQFNLPGDKRAS